MPEKKDLLDLQKENLTSSELQSQYNITKQEAQRIQDIQLLTFYQSDKNKIVAKSPSAGFVLRHKEGGNQINPGETWFVELERHDTYCFAKPIEKVDARFFFDLRVDQIETITDIIFSKHKTIIEPTLEERIKEEIRHEIEEEYNKQLKNDTKHLEDKNRILEKELKTIKIKHQKALDALEKANQQKTQITPQKNKDVKENLSHQIATYFPSEYQDLKIRRIQPDMLESESFTKPNYFVHISSDQTLMIIRPHAQGNILCTDNKIALKGLGLITEYGGPEDLVCRYNSRYGGFEVNLKYRPSTSQFEC